MSEQLRFIARQPILDERQRVCAYELLFRDGVENFFRAKDEDGGAATGQAIADSFLLFGVGALTNRTKAFINFPRALLTNGCAHALPTEHVVIEILEDIEPDTEVIEACNQLKSMGYTLALDDYAFQPGLEALADLVHIVKIEMPRVSYQQIAQLAERAVHRKPLLLAEKVETREQFLEAKRSGCQLFQGFFFSEPEVISRREVTPFKQRYLQLMKDLHKPGVSFDEITKIIEPDVSLSLKLLRYVNSAVFGLRHSISSIRQALTLLGENQLRKWASIVALGEISSDKPEALLRMALVRARFAEDLAARTGSSHRKSDFFLLGLFSLLDVMLGRPLAEVLAELPLANDLESGLLRRANYMGQVLKLVEAQEKGDWSAVDEIAASLGIEREIVAAIYPDALQFADDVAAVPVESKAAIG